MPWKQQPDLWGLVGALVISLLSGFIAIANRLAGGQKFSLLWLAAQVAGAVLAGYLVYDAYPLLIAQTWWPSWLTMPISVALAGHFGGKAFALAEKLLYRQIKIIPDGETNQ